MPSPSDPVPQKRARAYHSPEERAAIEEGAEEIAVEPASRSKRRALEASREKGIEAVSDPIEADVRDPVAETKLLREMLAQQQQALRRSIQAALESEKAAEVANAKLSETQDQLLAREKELATQRLEVGRTADTASKTTASLNAELTRAAQALDKAQQWREWERHLLLRALPCLALCAAFVWAVWKFSPPVVPPAGVRTSPATTIVNRREPSEEDTSALDQLNKVLAQFPSGRIPGALAEANRLLASSGSPPCSIEWVGGERAVLLASNRGAKAPLTDALTRCSGALQKLLASQRF